ncbi:MAG: hypothetical protein RLY93_06330 [Sumerlaeia bacterium]
MNVPGEPSQKRNKKKRESSVRGCLASLQLVVPLVVVVVVIIRCSRTKESELLARAEALNRPAAFTCQTIPIPPGAVRVDCAEMVSGSESYNLVVVHPATVAELIAFYENALSREAALVLRAPAVDFAAGPSGKETRVAMRGEFQLALSAVANAREPGSTITLAWYNRSPNFRSDFGPGQQQTLQETFQSMKKVPTH